MRSDEAKLILDSQVFKDAFSTLKNDVVKRIEIGKLNSDEEHNAVLSLQLLARVKAYIENEVSREETDNKVKEFNLKARRGIFG